MRIRILAMLVLAALLPSRVPAQVFPGVEWDTAEPITDGFDFGCRMSRAVLARPEVERADMRSELLSDLSDFDVMCADLWKRRDVR